MTDTVAYTSVDGSDVAYLIVGEPGGRDLVLMLGGVLPMDALEEDPVGARLLTGLHALGRLTLFDRRGIGLSGPIPDDGRAAGDWWLDDLNAVIEAAELDRPTVVAHAGACTVAAIAANDTDTVGGVVMFEPLNPWLFTERDEERWLEANEANRAGTLDLVAMLAPSRSDDPVFRSWWESAGRRGAGPAVGRTLLAGLSPGDTERSMVALSTVEVPVLVLRRPGAAFWPPDQLAEADRHIACDLRVELPGEDLLLFGSELDPVLAEIGRFLTGEAALPPPTRFLAAVLFTDLERSTEMASSVGDHEWRNLIEWHDEIAARLVARFGGEVVKATGDGVLATFPSVIAAHDAAVALIDALAERDLKTRAAVHVGDIERRDGDVAGLAVHVAARVMGLADPGDLVMTAVAHGAAIGSGLTAESLGSHSLRGIEGTWELVRILD